MSVTIQKESVTAAQVIASLQLLLNPHVGKHDPARTSAMKDVRAGLQHFPSHEFSSDGKRVSVLLEVDGDAQII